jgi:hypothetical protein
MGTERHAKEMQHIAKDNDQMMDVQDLIKTREGMGN